MKKSLKFYKTICPAVMGITLILSSYHVIAQSKSPTADQLFKQAQYETNVKKDYESGIQLSKRALQLSSANTDIRQLLGKLYLLTGKTEYAREELKRVLARHPDNMDVLNNLISLEINEKNFTDALKYIQSATRFKPNDTELKLKKAFVYAQQFKYAAAIQISETLFQSNPNDKKIRMAYVDHLMGFLFFKRKNGDTTEVLSLLDRAYSIDPHNKDLLLYLVNINYECNNLEKAIFFCEKALEQDQQDTIFLSKKASFLLESGKYREATQTSLALVKIDSSNIRFREMCLYQLLFSHQKFADSGYWNTSLEIFRDAAQVIPNDSLIYTILSTLYFHVKKYDSSLYYAGLGLKLYPDEPVFLLKKAEALEAQGRYKAASITANKLVSLAPGNVNNRLYARDLKMKSFKNQIGLLYLHSMFDKEIKSADIASLQYIRFHKKGSIGTRVNFGRRASCEGIQLEAETYLTHNKKFYSYALAGWSPSVIFPGWRLSYSLFSTLGKGWELETGARYLYADSLNTISGVLSMGKYWGSNFTNFRGFLVYDDGNWFHSYLLSHRFYLNSKKDYILLFGSVGSIPDDPSRNFLFNSTLGFTTWSAGLGFQCAISTATSINLTGSWIYQKTSELTYYNQYDIYISLLRKF